MSAARLRALAAAALLLVLSGCAAIPWPQTPRAPFPDRSAEGWLDLRGVLHVHTRGVIDGVSVIPGFEINSAGASLLALGVDELPPATKDPAELVRWTHAAGGLAVEGHFEHSRLAQPEAWRAAAPDAVELVNLHANALEQRAALGWRVPLLPSGVTLRSLLTLSTSNLAR